MTTSPEAAATVAELTGLLLGDDHEHVHGPFRRLAADRRFHPDQEAAPDERVAASYERLRLLNGSVDALALATDPYRLAAAHEWTAPLDGALAVVTGIHYNLFLGSLLDHTPHEKRPLDDYAAMRRIGTFLCTELGHGNDAAALETTAVYDPDSRTFTLHTPSAAAQKFMPNTSMAGGPKDAVVAARLIVAGRDRGIFLFLVPLSDEHGMLPGVTVRPLPRRPGSPVDHCMTSFDEVLLPFEALLSGDHGSLSDDGTFTSALGSPRKRFLTSIGRVTIGKLCMSGCAVGGARVGVTTAVRYSHHRLVSGRRRGERVPVWAHRSHHGPLLVALATTYAMHALHRAALDRFAGHDPDDPADAAETERLVAVAKGWTTWSARSVLGECRERCGAQGLLPANGIITAAHDIEGTITAEGDNLALWAKAGAELLLAADPDAEDPAETGVPGTADAGRLADPDVLNSLMLTAERQHMARARAALRGATGTGGGRRWDAAAPWALAAVTARAERLAAEALLTAAHRAADPTAHRLLLALHRLFALHHLNPRSGPLLAEGHLTPSAVHRIPEAIEESIALLAEHALTLVDAFGLPEEFLRTRPIATGDHHRAFDDPEAHWHTAPSA